MSEEEKLATPKDWECEVCGKKLHATADEAYNQGWDTPPYFSGYVKCRECPINGTAIWAMWNSGYGVDNNSGGIDD